MALNAAKTGKKIADILTDSRATDEMKERIIEVWTDIMTAIYGDIKSDSVITVAEGIACAVDPGSHAGATTSTGTATIS